MSEKQTHRKLSGSVRIGQFSTQSGLNDFSGLTAEKSENRSYDSTEDIDS
jgi:hypothetical protein